jgi:hypothetical protein
MFGRMIGTMKDFFSVVGFVTLALGGLGVMNIMLIAVRERTREIGLRKAMGATSAVIQRQFFLEGFVLTMLSGAIGFGVAIALCAAVNTLPMPTRFQGMTSPGRPVWRHPARRRRCHGHVSGASCRRVATVQALRPGSVTHCAIHGPRPPARSSTRGHCRVPQSRARGCHARYLVGHRVGGDAALLRRRLQGRAGARLPRRVWRRRVVMRPGRRAAGRR